jgi:SOS-response transcriptional repressor LexA
LGVRAQTHIPPFAVEVRDETLRGAGLRDGDTAWINPQMLPREHDVVLARIEGRKGLASLRLCLLLRGRSGVVYLAIQPTRRARRLPHARFEIIGPATGAICRLSSRQATRALPRRATAAVARLA